ncbi:ribosome small subunit-dependent GTPase A [Geotoga petraea]|jgi:ribosome biogenesis GTPase|uniref:Small ribosomal subunit biogenesis GTPase RsgA n=1 Tax=Geotoga petraea TaxID=28234 RepID=A0A1G6JNH0_9BACT|nr:ribosome small subunit-dependent GTPase A [Geotoga petraea]MDK2945409.1 ribosome biosis GTPase / thiamine phosphate phosphatase [Geotoga sp.]TGG88266.1 ribosome small subunit-dependent GTPase A [Geotoga petraea]SDC19985.1 ribosome biogenesis GTPase [Geotoga petraea]
MSWNKGIVTRFHSNMATVNDLKTNTSLECVLRGKFKVQKIRPIVGDYIEYSKDDNNPIGKIENILERKNILYRPSIANLDQVILVTTLKYPEVDFLIVDKFIVQAEKEDLDIIIVLNKIDLLTDEDQKLKEKFLNIYSNLYTVIETSTKQNLNVEIIREKMKNKVSTLAGMSGVGKSSILNMINPGLKLRIGNISDKLKRGKHTTTHSELLRFDFGGFVADTPGFANIETYNIEKENLKDYFYEFYQYSRYCQFVDCQHVNEPNCGVKAAVRQEEISQSRYDNYLSIYSEIEKKVKKW